MTSSEIKDPRVLDLKKKYAEKFEEKAPHTEVDVTSWSAVAVFILHALSATLAIFGVKYWGLGRIEIMIVGVLWGAIMICLEYFKSAYSERYHIAFLKAVDTDLSDEIRAKAYERMKITKNILLVFWAISLSVVIFSASKFAMENAPQAKTLAYDTSIRNAFEQKNESLKIAQDRGAKLATIRSLQAEVTGAQTLWQNHKAAVDAKNTAVSGEYDNSLWMYLLLGLVIGAGIEAGIFYMRRFHEKKQYEIHQSFLDESTTKSKPKADPKESGSAETKKAEEEAKLKIEIEKLQESRKKDIADIQKWNAENAQKEQAYKTMIETYKADLEKGKEDIRKQSTRIEELAKSINTYQAKIRELDDTNIRIVAEKNTLERILGNGSYSK